MKNKHGLSRHIPSKVRRKLRQEAGFGCIICGIAIGEYEHIDPEFVNATVHDPNHMAFLCCQCHAKVTRGHISKETVKSAKLAPKALQEGFSFEAFDLGTEEPVVTVGAMAAFNCDYILTLNDRPIIWISPPETENGPFLLNAELWDGSGNLHFSIIQNEWRCRPDNWDCEVVGRKIRIKSLDRTLLEIETAPPNKLSFNILDICIEGYHVMCGNGLLTVETPTGQVFKADSFEVGHTYSAIVLNSNGFLAGYKAKSANSYVNVIGSMTLGPITTQQSRVDFSISRNDSCRCGSGSRYKRCCGSYR